MITSSTISPTPTKPGPYFMSDPKETRSKKVKRILCKVLCSRFFPQVRKKHYLIFQVYVHISRSSLILLKKKNALSPSLYNIQKQTNKQKLHLILFYWVFNDILAFMWHSVVLTGKAKYHGYIMTYRIFSQDILLPV